MILSLKFHFIIFEGPMTRLKPIVEYNVINDSFCCTQTKMSLVLISIIDISILFYPSLVFS